MKNILLIFGILIMLAFILLACTGVIVGILELYDGMVWSYFDTAMITFMLAVSLVPTIGIEIHLFKLLINNQ